MVVRCMENHATIKAPTMGRVEDQQKWQSTIIRIHGWHQMKAVVRMMGTRKLLKNPTNSCRMDRGWPEVEKYQPWRQTIGNYNKNANNQQKATPWQDYKEDKLKKKNWGFWKKEKRTSEAKIRSRIIMMTMTTTTILWLVRGPKTKEITKLWTKSQ